MSARDCAACSVVGIVACTHCTGTVSPARRPGASCRCPSIESLRFVHAAADAAAGRRCASDSATYGYACRMRTAADS